LDRGGDREEGGAQMTGDDDALAMVVEASTEMSDAPPAGRGSLFDAMSPAMLAAAIARRLLGPRPVVDWPQPGYWMIRLVSGGPEVPACICVVQTLHEPGIPENLMERSPFLAAFILGKPAGLDEVWKRRGRESTGGNTTIASTTRAGPRPSRLVKPSRARGSASIGWINRCRSEGGS
jgi:hypothetical protein